MKRLESFAAIAAVVVVVRGLARGFTMADAAVLAYLLGLLPVREADRRHRKRGNGDEA